MASFRTPEPNPYLYRFDSAIPRPHVLAELAAMPTRLREAVKSAVTTRPRPDAWSAFETFCHVRDATLAYAARFRWIVFNDDPFLPDYDENNWVATAKDTPADIPEILEQVAASRADLIRVLSRLSDAQWQRTRRHEVGGTVVLDHYARRKVVHEAIHLGQIRLALIS